LRLQTRDQETPTQKTEDLNEFIREASEVKSMTMHSGWNILTRDLLEYRDGILERLAYIDPSKTEHKEARILFIAIDKIFNIVNDYQENRVKAVELLNKLQNPELTVAMDIDTE
jgi:hypothetical protein